MPRKKPIAKPVAGAAKARGTRASKTPKPATPCVVCGAEVAPFSTEELCWVCRRLKISAWRDIENQTSMQE